MNHTWDELQSIMEKTERFEHLARALAKFYNVDLNTMKMRLFRYYCLDKYDLSLARWLNAMEKLSSEMTDILIKGAMEHD